MIERSSAARRHQPRGLTILHEDRDILVVAKAPGLLTIATETSQDRTAYHLLTDYVRKGNAKARARIFIVHRLDRDTSGVLLFAKTPQAQRQLQDHWADTEKKYLAVVHGRLSPKTGILTSYLAENAAHRMYSTPDPARGQLARTAYQVLKETPAFSLLEITLLTGRKNQIRVHLAERGHPVVGDKKYGQTHESRQRLALHALSLTFNHPFTGRRLTFTAAVPAHIARWTGALNLA
ncbi:MAG: RNA pseudouridine synthase [Kiritimatiellaeota bacterium]|nr:RNA pseudouridine synthase [Kiritimatiellota bacterium]